MPREVYTPSEEFNVYMEEIVASPVYYGMPDLRWDDGSIQWEAPSNRSGGKFRDSHTRRLMWWRDKAASIGISVSENQWISKTAKAIHPSKKRPCKVCGRIMDIRYCYFTFSLRTRIKKLPYFRGDIVIDDLTNILKFVPQFILLYGSQALRDLPTILACKKVPHPPALKTTAEWLDWLERVYIPTEPSLLSPGAMSNAPDRLDRFHTFNRCCRPTADKGRSKENLALYSTDRRAFEHWVDGNWVAANMLMGLINSNPNLKSEHCLNGVGRSHPRPCSADHIGPVSLGFAHRPEFQLLCKPCNSAKNNRLYYSDVLNLRRAEQNGNIVTSWYMDELWKLLRALPTDAETSLRLYRILRDNRHNAMMMLAKYIEAGHYLFLYSFLNLEYANYNYKINGFQVDNHIVTADISRTRSNLEYVREQKARRVRVAYSSLIEYSAKKNRNGLNINLPENMEIFNKSIAVLDAAEDDYREYNEKLMGILGEEDVSDSDLRTFVTGLPDRNNKSVEYAKRAVKQMMDNLARFLAGNWDNLRYLREISE